ncbi:MAG: hypothetical protein MZV64_60260 [Ignavibacteriales bacterium]|nr:hypothetical protein [Ignavibacteriales bacterium]
MPSNSPRRARSPSAWTRDGRQCADHVSKTPALASRPISLKRSSRNSPRWIPPPPARRAAQVWVCPSAAD